MNEIILEIRDIVNLTYDSKVAKLYDESVIVSAFQAKTSFHGRLA